jgi:lipopolysaccharide/colanic/teichoic acid biosynthesis glycosyltransferase
VGPRPLTPRTWEDAGETWKGIRAQVVPGLIGTWSLVGVAVASADALEAMDLEYLREWSLGLDLKIMIRTLRGSNRPRLPRGDYESA